MQGEQVLSVVSVTQFHYSMLLTQRLIRNSEIRIICCLCQACCTLVLMLHTTLANEQHNLKGKLSRTLLCLSKHHIQTDMDISESVIATFSEYAAKRQEQGTSWSPSTLAHILLFYVLDRNKTQEIVIVVKLPI